MIWIPGPIFPTCIVMFHNDGNIPRFSRHVNTIKNFIFDFYKKSPTPGKRQGLFYLLVNTGSSSETIRFRVEINR
jgi:hypothetical protein